MIVLSLLRLALLAVHSKCPVMPEAIIAQQHLGDSDDSDVYNCCICSLTCRVFMSAEWREDVEFLSRVSGTAKNAFCRALTTILSTLPLYVTHMWQ